MNHHYDHKARFAGRSSSDAAAWWAENDRELAQERAAYARLVARVGAKNAAELHRTARRVARDLADEQQIARLKRAGATERDRSVQLLRLKMQARRNSVEDCCCQYALGR